MAKKKAPAVKKVARKASVKSASARSGGGGRPGPAKKAPAKKAPAKKVAAKKAVKKAAPAKKAPAKPTRPGKKAAKAVVKKVLAKKAVVKKAAPKKAIAPKKVVAKKVALKKAVVKKTAPVKAVVKKVAPAKPAAPAPVKKAAPAPVERPAKPVAKPVQAAPPAPPVKEVATKEAPPAKTAGQGRVKAPVQAVLTGLDPLGGPVRTLKRPVKDRYQMEFYLRATPGSLYDLISTPSGFSEWFCDDVNVRGDEYGFVWNGEVEIAECLSVRAGEMIRFHWQDDDDPGSFFELRIRIDPMTNETCLVVTDHAWPRDLEEAKALWVSQVQTLQRVLGA